MSLDLNVQAVANVGPMIAGVNAAANAIAGSTAKMNGSFAALAEGTAASTQVINVNMIKSAAVVQESGTVMSAKLREVGAAAGLAGGGFSGLIGALGVAAGIGFAGTILTGFVNKIIDAADKMNDFSISTGISAENLQRLKFVADLGKDSFEGLTKGIVKQNVAQVEALSGGKEQLQAFKDLGVTINDLRTLSPEEIFLKIAKAVHDSNAPQELNNALLKIYSRSFIELVPILRRGDEEIRQLMGDATVMDTATAAAAERLHEQMVRLENELNKGVYPAFASVAEVIAKMFSTWAASIGQFLDDLKAIGRDLGLIGINVGGFETLITSVQKLVSFLLPLSLLGSGIKNIRVALDALTASKRGGFIGEEPKAQLIPLGGALPLAAVAGKAAESSRLPALQAAFDKELAATGIFHTASLREELAHWDKILATVRLSLKDRESLELEQAKRREKIQDEENTRSEQVAKTKVKTDRDMMAELLKIADEGNKALKKGIDERIEAEKKAEKVRQAILLTDLGITRDHDLAALQIEENHVESLANLGIISQKDRLAALQRFEDERFQIELQAAVERANLVASDPVAFEQAFARIEEIYNQHNVTMGKLADDAVALQKRPFDNFFSTIQSSFQGMLQGILQGTQTVMGAVRNVFQSIIATIVNSFIKMGLQWLSTQLFMAATGKAIKKASAKEDALTDAKAAGKGAFKSVMEHVPFPLNFILAPAAAAAAFSAVLAFDKGGVLGRDALGLLHKNEMVLPAHLSEGLQRMISSAQQSGGGSFGPISVTNHFSAVDEEGMRGLIQRHGLDLAQEVIRQIKLGAIEVPS